MTQSYLGRLVDAVLASKLVGVLAIIIDAAPFIAAIVAFAFGASRTILLGLVAVATVCSAILVSYFASLVAAADAKRIALLTDRVSELAGISAALSLRYTDEPRYKDPRYGFRVGVKNVGSLIAENVKVELRSIEDDPGALAHIHGTVGPPWQIGRHGGGTMNCRINPGNEDQFDVIRFLRRHGTPDCVWGVETAENGFQELNLVMENDYIFRLAASAANVAARSFSIRISKESSGDLVFVPQEGFDDGSV